MNQIINEIKDLTFLEWSKIRESSGTAGSFLKSYMNYNNRKIYFKLSDYNKIDGIIGHECINEIIIDRLLSILGFHHLNYYLINANIKIDEAIINTYLCASYDFKEKGESKIALDTFFELKRKENEKIFDFCERYNFINNIYEMMVVDYIILNRDRHGANIEVLYDNKKDSYRLAPLFDHGLSLLCKVREEQIDDYDVMEEKVTNSFIGTRSTLDNLMLIPYDKLPKIKKLNLTDKNIIFKDLDNVLSPKRIDKIWEMIWKRVCYYERICNKE